jgi:SNF2 family DNA or RNA helicase
MRYKPHEYQVYATNFILEHPIAAILLDMGLGKSVITLTAIYELCLNRFEVSKVLVIAPLRVARDTWPAEIEKWDHLKGLTYSVAIGTESERRNALIQIADIYLINRENVDWLVNKSQLPFDYDMIVIDELSSFKAYGSKRFKALRRVRPKVKRIVGLTGTPSGNGLMDLWAQIGILDLGKRLGRFISHYRNTFFTPDKRNQQMVFSYKPLSGAEDKIYHLISDITISMRSTDYLQMPECVMNEVIVGLSEKEKKVYETMKRDMILSLEEKEIDAGSAASLSNKLLQMANGAVYAGDRSVVNIHDRKLEALEDLIEAANGKPVLIAYWYKHDLERIQSRFTVTKLDMTESIKEWNKGDIPIAIIHPASAGHGLNLQTGGSTLIWFGLTWSLELYQQTNARLWRQGQKDTVVIHHLIVKGTIDERVMKSLKNKDSTQAALIDAVKATLKGEEPYEKQQEQYQNICSQC